MLNSKYNTLYGIYEPQCGLDNVLCSWGHDEYLYQILKYNQVELPDEALYIIRFHSLYPYHQGGDYMRFQDDKDKRFLKWLKLFNQYDLYSKSDIKIDEDKMREYYINLINKYIGQDYLYI